MPSQPTPLFPFGIRDVFRFTLVSVFCLLPPVSCLLFGVGSSAAAQAAFSDPGPGRVEVRGEWLYVDGEPFLVKGVSYSPAGPAPRMEQDFKRIAAAGFNTIRTRTPLSPEALDLADRYGLMVLQGIWAEPPDGASTGQALREAVLRVVRRDVERARGRGNVLAFLVGSELSPEAVFRLGVPEASALLKRADETVKQADPARLVSYAGSPSLAFLDTSAWDLVAFNLHPDEPANIAYTFGFRSYIEQLRRGVARGRPLIVTEASLSEPPAGAPAAEMMTLWDELYQAGAQGGVIAEPFDEALSRYNQAILLSPVTGERYRDRIPVTVYATEAPAQLRVRLDRRRWMPLTRLGRHWWKAMVPLTPKDQPGAHVLELEAADRSSRVLVSRQRTVLVGPPEAVLKVAVTTDRPSYEVADSPEPVRYTITVTGADGAPAANRPVAFSMLEPHSKTAFTQSKATDAAGRIEGSYLAGTPGPLVVSAAVAQDPGSPERRVGAETLVVVRKVPRLHHQASLWEQGLPEDVVKELRHHEHPSFQLSDAGREPVIDYERYGTFLDAGTPTYRFEVSDWEGLAAAAGEGVYPNEAGLLRDPAFQAAQREGKLAGSHWDFTWIDDIQLGFFKWAASEEEVGVKQFFTAVMLERAGLLQQAVKAYYAVLVHFPASVGWTGFDPPTPYYVGKTAQDKLEAVLRLHPELGLRLAEARITMEHGFDNDVGNDRMSINPGKLVRVSPDAVNPPTVDVSALRVTRELGKDPVRLVQYENGHWRMLVNGAPWTVRGIAYMPSAVGETPDEGSLRDWIAADRNTNGQPDVLETFVDANRNNQRDADEPVVGDFAMLRDMGVNTLRLFHHNHQAATAKPLLRKLHEQYGLMVMMGDFVGMYTIGSGAKWEEGTNYLDRTQRRRMFESVKRMVREYKDEPYLLMWVLGNENNYGGVHGIVGGVGNAGKHPEAYYGFINELATWIHQADPRHPVALGNGEWMFLDVIAKQAPAIDIFGANVYRGPHGFGRSFFGAVRQYLDKPVLITEYGCPAYQLRQAREIAERDQALYHFGNWVDLADNLAGRGLGNAIGGAAFEWSDEWWKAGQPPRFSPTVQETRANWPGAFPGGFMFEEWLGLVSQGDGHLSPFLRQPRTSYRMYQALWKRF